MKKYLTKKVVEYLLNEKRLDSFKTYASNQVGSKVFVCTEDSERCYSQSSYYSKGTMITLGLQFYEKSFNAPSSIPSNEIRDKYREMAQIYYGTFYHELFHLLYTSFGTITDYVSHLNWNFQEFCFNIANILEDQTIEEAGTYWYPESKKFILKVREVFSQPSMLLNLKDAIENNPEAPETLLAYLLLHVRGVDLSDMPEYKLWKDNEDFLTWGAHRCVHEMVAESRARMQVAYAIQLAKILNMKAPDKDAVEKGDISEDPGDVGPMSPSSSGGKIISQTIGKSTNTAKHNYNSPTTKAQDAEIPDESKMQEATKTMQASHESSGTNGGTESPDTSEDLTTQGISMLASDEPVIGLRHVSEKLSKYFDTSKMINEYNDVVRKHEKEIRQVVAQIKKMKALNNTAWQHYKMSGKLDMSTIYKKGNYKVFKKKEAPREESELVVQLLVDNSGSMRGNKARLAGQALIVFCEALNRLHIPFAVDAFTEGDCAITINLKDYDELYSKTKTNMTLFTEELQVRDLSTWCGNVDEANLKYVSHNLADQPQKDKLLIVISDGATCGSYQTLGRLAESIENSGMMVLGIGIYDHNVESIYKKHMVVSNSDDLAKLGSFLNKWLVKLTFKGGR